MKTNDKKELHTKTVLELNKMLKEGNELLLGLHMDQEQSKLKNTKSLTTTRKSIAIIKTILKEKEAKK